MYTLKIRWMRLEGPTVVDETTMFIPANSVEAGSIIESPKAMESWEKDSFFNYQIEVPNPEAKTSDDKKWMPARLITVRVDHQDTTWYLASLAWLLGADGKTIEKLI